MEQFSNNVSDTSAEFMQKKLRQILKDDELTVSENEGTYTITFKDGKQTTYSVSGDNSSDQQPTSSYTPLTATISNNQIWDIQRNPPYPVDGDTVTISGLQAAYKYGGGRGVPNGHYLKFTSLNTVSSNNYPQVQLDEYDANNNFVGKYSDVGTLYKLSGERQIYLFTTLNYGYAVCLIPEEAVALQKSNGGTFTNCSNVTSIN